MRRREAAIGKARQTPHHGGRQLARKIGRPLTRRRSPMEVEDRAEDGAGVLAGEKALAREHLPENDAQGEDVGAAVELLAPDLLGSHVAELPLELALVRRGGA